MRIKRATIADVFAVHKLWVAFMCDTDQDLKGREKDLSQWIPFFSSPAHYCHLLLHGKATVGLGWGYLPEPGGSAVRVEGLFIKRGFRSKLSSIRSLTTALGDECRKAGAVAISSVVSENQLRRVKRKGFKVSALIVERELRGGDR